MEDIELSAFQNEKSSKKESGKTLPETPPEPLLDGFIPPIKDRAPIAPEHPTCDVKTGDLFVIHIGTDAMEYYGFLILSAYANKLIGINLHNQAYSCRELESWVELYGEYKEEGSFESEEMRIYSNTAPVKNAKDTKTGTQGVSQKREDIDA